MGDVPKLRGRLRFDCLDDCRGGVDEWCYNLCDEAPIPAVALTSLSGKDASGTWSGESGHSGGLTSYSAIGRGQRSLPIRRILKCVLTATSELTGVGGPCTLQNDAKRDGSWQ